MLGMSFKQAMGKVSARDDCCRNPSCAFYQQRTEFRVEGGETYCMYCSHKMGHGIQFENELDFGTNSRPHGVFVRPGDGDRKS